MTSFGWSRIHLGTGLRGFEATSLSRTLRYLVDQFLMQSTSRSLGRGFFFNFLASARSSIIAVYLGLMYNLQNPCRAGSSCDSTLVSEAFPPANDDNPIRRPVLKPFTLYPSIYALLTTHILSQATWRFLGSTPPPKRSQSHCWTKPFIDVTLTPFVLWHCKNEPLDFFVGHRLGIKG